MWVPASTGAAFELSPILSPLAPVQDRIVVLSGLAHMEADSEIEQRIHNAERRGAESELSLPEQLRGLPSPLLFGSRSSPDVVHAVVPFVTGVLGEKSFTNPGACTIQIIDVSMAE